MGQLIQNAIKTPDGTIMVSVHRHDFNKHIDKNGHVYMIDGGLDYLKRSTSNGAPAPQDLALYDDESFEVIRGNFLRGSLGVNGDEPLKWVVLKDMSDDYLLAVIKYNSERGMDDSKASMLYRQELDYRQREQLEKQNDMKHLVVPIGTRFTSLTNDEGIVFTVEKWSRNFKITWEDGQKTKTGYTADEINHFFESGIWVVAQPKELFITDDGVQMFEGDSWFYVNMRKLRYAPKKTNKMDYRGTKNAPIVTFSTKEAALDFLTIHRPLFSLEDIRQNIGHIDNLLTIAVSRM